MYMTARGVNHGTLNVGGRKAVKIGTLIQSCEILEESLEVIVGVLNVLHMKHDQLHDVWREETQNSLYAEHIVHHHG